MYHSSVGEYACVLCSDVADTDEVVATATEHASRCIIVIINLHASVRAESHVEAQCGNLAGTVGGRRNHILEDDVELAVLTSASNLRVGSHIHPA